MKNISIKLLVIALMGLLLYIPLTMEEGIIYERMGNYESVVATIEKKWAGSQIIRGPVIMIPWQLHKTKQVKQETKQIVHQGIYILQPEQIDNDIDISTSKRSLGIYSVPVYNSKISMQGEFALTQLARHKETLVKRYNSEQFEWGTPSFVILVSDPRGITKAPIASWNNAPIDFSNADPIKIKEIKEIHAQLPSISGIADKASFSVELEVKGTKNFFIDPAGKSNSIDVTSNWQHPGFIGDLLPEKYTIDEQGFNAHWATSSFSFSSNIISWIEGCLLENQCYPIYANNDAGIGAGISLIEPVDIYTQSNRSIKYGILFIITTFVVFFLFEVLKDLKIHPIQYAMVGMALTVFYLLLISLSEHTDFYLAYAIAALSCSSLLGIYLGTILQSKLRALWFSLGLLGMYALLYLIISSEDFALLMGSILVFTLLAISMLITRNVNWYHLGEHSISTSK